MDDAYAIERGGGDLGLWLGMVDESFGDISLGWQERVIFKCTARVLVSALPPVESKLPVAQIGQLECAPLPSA